MSPLDTLVDWLSSTAFTAFGAPTSWAEVIGFVTGALCVYLVAKQHILNWPLGIANNLTWILLFATAGLYADSGLQVVFIALALWGWYQWLRGGPNRTRRTVSSTSLTEWLGLGAAGLAGAAFLTWLLATHTDSTVPLADATTTTLSLMATYGQTMKKWESWLLWMAADIIFIPLYHHKGLTLTAILYVGFFLLCVKGLLEWRRALREVRAGAPLASTPAGPLESTLQ